MQVVISPNRWRIIDPNNICRDSMCNQSAHPWTWELCTWRKNRLNPSSNSSISVLKDNNTTIIAVGQVWRGWVSSFVSWRITSVGVRFRRWFCLFRLFLLCLFLFPAMLVLIDFSNWEMVNLKLKESSDHVKLPNWSELCWASFE